MIISTAALMAVMSGVITQYPSPAHDAWDISCQVGRPVYALHSGSLITRKHHGLGNIITINGTALSSTYAHLHTTTPNRYVTKGELIGTCGNTGAWTTGPHLHLEVSGIFQT